MRAWIDVFSMLFLHTEAVRKMFLFHRRTAGDALFKWLLLYARTYLLGEGGGGGVRNIARRLSNRAHGELREAALRLLAVIFSGCIMHKVPLQAEV